MKYYVTIDGQEHCVALKKTPNGVYTCRIDDGDEFDAQFIRRGNHLHLISDNVSLSLATSLESDDLTAGGPRQRVAVESAALRALRSATGSSSGQDRGGLIASPMPGRVVKNLVAEGDTVTTGQGVVVVEAMKMENELKATLDGTVVKVYASADDLVEASAPLIEIEPHS